MTTWVIGDIQGCANAFEALLAEIEFDPGRDRLWLAGDLVNRGADSLSVLRRAAELDARCVLGNHDLHLLATAAGARDARPQDTLEAVLDAPDRDQLLDWLRHRPLLHHDAELGWTMVHAGLAPDWSLKRARKRAAEVEQIITGPEAEFREFFAWFYGNGGNGKNGKKKRAHWKRLRKTVNAFTRLRCLTSDGEIDDSYTGPAEGCPKGLTPWYTHPERRSRGERIVFGHWASLRLDPGTAAREAVRHVDTGCIWGGCLTALDLQTGATRSVDCDAAGEPRSSMLKK